MELLKSITPRLADSQSNLKPLAANALSAVASSVGPDAAVKVKCKVLVQNAQYDPNISIVYGTLPYVLLNPRTSLKPRYVFRGPVPRVARSVPIIYSA